MSPPLALLLGCALLLRALIPTGWMPATDGSFRIELCAGMGEDGATARFQQEAQRVFDRAMVGTAHHKGDGDRSDDVRKHQPCAFAGLAMAMAHPDRVELAPPAAAPFSLPRPALLAAVGRGLAAPPPPSTGPPILT